MLSVRGGLERRADTAFNIFIGFGRSVPCRASCCLNIFCVLFWFRQSTYLVRALPERREAQGEERGEQEEEDLSHGLLICFVGDWGWRWW